MIPPGHIDAVDRNLSGRIGGERDLENFFHSCIGNGFHVGVVAWILNRGLLYHGVLNQCVIAIQLCRRYLRILP